MDYTHALLPSSVSSAIVATGGPWGWLRLRFVEREQLIVIAGHSHKNGAMFASGSDWLNREHSSAHDDATVSGVWHRAEMDLHNAGLAAARRSGIVRPEAFSAGIKGARSPDLNAARFVLTLAFDGTEESWAGWIVSKAGAQLLTVDGYDENGDTFDVLGRAWPRAELRDELVTVVGVGSIGSAACEALSGYAIRRFALVDPDFLSQRNLARHRGHSTDVGRLKVNVMKDILTTRDPQVSVETYPLDVVEDADVMRPLFIASSIVLCCSDGIASRRVASHLAVRAGVPLILACVLEDGEIGEIIRVWPGRTACLNCMREALVSQGSIDPEPALDLGYGTGLRHRPMTAVGGDLDLIGKVAAKTTVATILERRGEWNQRLPSDHCVFGLRPSGDLPKPFDVSHPLEVRWGTTSASLPGCPTCSTAP